MTSVADARGSEERQLSFVQISDSHIGFTRPENPDVAGTLQKDDRRHQRAAVQPSFVVHTGDLTHLSKPEQFDTVKNDARARSRRRSS
jgi:Icc protein